MAHHPFLVPGLVAAGVIGALVLFGGTASAATKPSGQKPVPEPPDEETNPNAPPVPAPGQPTANLPPLALEGAFPVGTVVRAIDTSSGAFIHSAPNELVSTRIGRIANGSHVAILVAGPPSPDDHGGKHVWTQITTAGGMNGFIADDLLGPPLVVGAGGQLQPPGVAGIVGAGYGGYGPYFQQRLRHPTGTRHFWDPRLPMRGRRHHPYGWY
jgi:hypothetical protein